MPEKRTNKVIKFTAHPNIDKALREYCKENNVLLSDVLKLILLDFLYNAKTSSPLVKSYIKRMYKEDLMPSPQSPKQSDLHKNYDLMQIMIKHVSDPEISEIVEKILEDDPTNGMDTV
ncbi:hypothetical protein WEU38_03840 [Cyanobacterium aponinum AL20118]|uniref:Uncharacterized protein n=1 Tax=Cyanobacterium aponinum AL20115 TaxID=3090662 RepID=A0AAF0ZCJ2_9CHRO|nr:hypothetical protein [Cyanobacterium aponinum]WPF89418.1 hypothetical protein SAY89_03855 [Cyanobacterium aponinum AL20115]